MDVDSIEPVAGSKPPSPRYFTHLLSRNRLVAFLGLILVAGFAGVNYASYHVSGQYVREALINNELPLTSNNIYSEIQATLLRPIYVSSLMANDTFLKDWMLDGEGDIGRVTKYLREIKQKYGVFTTFLVSDLTKRYYHFEGILKTVSPSVPKDSWFFSMKSHPSRYRVDVDTNEAEAHRLTIFINHKVTDYDGSFIGVTGLGLDAANVSQLIRRYKRQFRRDIYFVDRDGLIKSHEDDRVIDRVNIREKAGIARFAGGMLESDSGSLEYPIDNDSVLLNYRFIPELDWYLLVEQRVSEAMRPIRRALYLNTGISLAITVLVLLLSGITVNRYQQRLESIAKTDKLTGLLNRQYFDAVLENMLQGVGRRHATLSLVVFDIDSFKPVNDLHGHLAGDRLLAAVADVAQKVVRSSDVVSRWGGDEFILLLPDCSLDDAVSIAEDLRRLVKESVHVEDTGMRVTISAGVAEYRGGDTYATLLQRADEALYLAKERGRDRVLVQAQTERGAA